uniref:[phosphatase 2A protein]-leucine-carboxy methyltransferase n=1 Tax=Lygus hesperus TaxID=30085 RepID=A0A0A9Z191_LYGHE
MQTIEKFVKLFVQHCRSNNQRAQVLSIGAGFDTLFFRLRAESCTCDAFVEVDFDDVVSDKRALLQHAEPQFAQNSVKSNTENITTYSHGYVLVGADVRLCDQFMNLLQLIPLFDPTQPTCILAECVLMYLDPDDSDAVLRMCQQLGSHTFSLVLNFEYCTADDTFGMYV